MSVQRVRPLVRAKDQLNLPTRGIVVGWEPDSGVLVELSSTREIVLAESLVAFTEAELDHAAAERRAVLLTFEEGDRQKPVIIGLVAPVPARPAPKPGASDEVVLIRGRDSIQLRCGAASITLRKDGKIVLRGSYVISRATKENRIAGGSVHFN
jgi:hypothetical protein